MKRFLFPPFSLTHSILYTILVLGFFGIFFLSFFANPFSHKIVLHKTGKLQIGRTNREVVIFGVRAKSSWDNNTRGLALSSKLFSFLQEIGGNLIHIGLPDQDPSHYLLAVLPKPRTDIMINSRQQIISFLTHMGKNQIFLLPTVSQNLLCEFQNIFNSSLRVPDLSAIDPLLNPLDVLNARGKPYISFYVRFKNRLRLVFAERSRFSFLAHFSRKAISKRKVKDLLLGNETSSFEEKLMPPNSSSLIVHHDSRQVFQNRDEPLICLGHDVMTNEAVNLPLSALNYNAQIIGSVGKGKSTLLSFLIPQVSQANVAVIIFDPKGEYAELLSSFGPTVLELGSEDGLRINLFDKILFDDSESIVALFQEVLRDSGSDLSPSMIRILRETIMVTSSSPSPSLKTFVSILHEKRSALIDKFGSAERMSYDGLINRLALLFSESVFNLLNTSEIGRNAVYEHLNHHPRSILILDMTPLTKGVRGIWDYKFLTTIILRLLLRKAINDGKVATLKQLLVFEESLFTFSHASDNKSLTTADTLLLLGRAHGMGSILVSQDPDAFSSLIRGNSSTKFIFQLSSSPTYLSRSIGVSEELSNEITQFGIGEYLIISPFLDSIRRVKLLHSVSPRESSTLKVSPQRVSHRYVYSTYDLFLTHLSSGVIIPSNMKNTGAPAGI